MYNSRLLLGLMNKGLGDPFHWIDFSLNGILWPFKDCKIDMLHIQQKTIHPLHYCVTHPNKKLIALSEFNVSPPNTRLDLTIGQVKLGFASKHFMISFDFPWLFDFQEFLTTSFDFLRLRMTSCDFLRNHDFLWLLWTSLDFLGFRTTWLEAMTS